MSLARVLRAAERFSETRCCFLREGEDIQLRVRWVQRYYARRDNYIRTHTHTHESVQKNATFRE